MPSWPQISGISRTTINCGNLRRIVIRKRGPWLLRLGAGIPCSMCWSLQVPYSAARALASLLYAINQIRL